MNGWSLRGKESMKLSLRSKETWGKKYWEWARKKWSNYIFLFISEYPEIKIIAITSLCYPVVVWLYTSYRMRFQIRTKRVQIVPHDIQKLSCSFSLQQVQISSCHWWENHPRLEAEKLLIFVYWYNKYFSKFQKEKNSSMGTKKTWTSLHLCTGCFLAIELSLESLAWIGLNWETSSLCFGSLGKWHILTCKKKKK